MSKAQTLLQSTLKRNVCLMQHRLQRPCKRWGSRGMSHPNCDWGVAMPQLWSTALSCAHTFSSSKILWWIKMNMHRQCVTCEGRGGDTQVPMLLPWTPSPSRSRRLRRLICPSNLLLVPARLSMYTYTECSYLSGSPSSRLSIRTATSICFLPSFTIRPQSTVIQKQHKYRRTSRKAIRR